MLLHPIRDFSTILFLFVPICALICSDGASSVLWLVLRGEITEAASRQKREEGEEAEKVGRDPAMRRERQQGAGLRW